MSNRSSTYYRRTMVMKRKKMTPDEYTEWKADHRRIEAMLQERIDYYQAKIKAKEQSP
jgi:hypothetical protein